MEYENHWSHFGGAPSVPAEELNASFLGRDIAVIVGGASAVIGPLTKLAFKSGSEWGTAGSVVKLTIGYDGDSFKVGLEGTRDVFLLDTPSNPETRAST